MRVSTSDFPLAWERKRRGGSCERLTDVSTNCSSVLLFVVAAVRTGRRALLSHTCSSPGRCSLRGRTTAHNFSCYLNNWLKEAQWLSLRHKHTHCLCCVITNNTESNPPSTQRRCVCVCVHLSPDYQYNYAATFCPLQLLPVPIFLIIFWLNVDGVSEDVLKHLVFIHNPKIFPLLLSQRRKENGKYLPVNVFTNHRYVQGRYFGWCRCYYCQSADHRWNHTPGSFKGHLGTFPGFFVEIKTGSFSQEVGPSTSLITETAKHDVCYNPNKVFFVPETKQSINSAVTREK